VEESTQRILALFDEHRARATFFTLGCVAERYPGLVRAIVAEGHELASHGMRHVRVHEQTPAAFRADIGRSKRLLEDVGGCAIRGYRAASFSITEQTDWAFDALTEEGYAYSSSVYPIRHDHYGIRGAPRFAYRPGTEGVLEVPISTVAVFGQNLPCGGGGYFRLLPYRLSRWGMRRVNRHDRQPCIFYFHPWEIDVEQPRIEGLPFKTRFRHYTNLARMERRLRAALTEFAWDRMDHIFLPGHA
jgi:polysaccharide deacetylase family protein (PEP-CTERM system associated)